MKRTNILSFLLMTLLIFGISSCNEKAEIVIEKTSFEFNENGGRAETGFTLNNVAKDAEITATADQEWITHIELIDNNSKVRFIVEPNATVKERNATVTLSCNGIEGKIAVQQGAEDIVVTITGVEQYLVSATVEVRDPEMFVCVMGGLKNYVDYWASDEELFQDDLKYYKQTARGKGYSLTEFLENEIGGYGIQDVDIETLAQPGQECYVYAYGITLSDEPQLLTKIYKAPFTGK